MWVNAADRCNPTIRFRKCSLRCPLFYITIENSRFTLRIPLSITMQFPLPESMKRIRTVLLLSCQFMRKERGKILELQHTHTHTRMSNTRLNRTKPVVVRTCEQCFNDIEIIFCSSGAPSGPELNEMRKT